MEVEHTVQIAEKEAKLRARFCHAWFGSIVPSSWFVMFYGTPVLRRYCTDARESLPRQRQCSGVVRTGSIVTCDTLVMCSYVVLGVLMWVRTYIRRMFAFGTKNFLTPPWLCSQLQTVYRL